MRKKLRNIFEKYYILHIFIWALIVNIVIELLSRDTIGSLFAHMASYPFYFLYNVLIIAFTLSLSCFFHKKKIPMAVISALWLALGVGNYVVLSYRITPFAAIDLSIMEWDMDFLESYLSIPLVIGMVLATVALVFALVVICKKAKSTEVHWKKSLLTAGSLFLVIYIIHGSLIYTGIYEERISNMQVSYDKFGFASCFTRSATERGIDEPEGYSQEVVEELCAELNIATSTELSTGTGTGITTELDYNNGPSEETPNVIVVQLESFFDPELLVDTEFSENPIPTFTQLSEEYSNGALEVAVVGAGTANTEFEVLTSMSVDFFGTGEYPYETILQEGTCESAAYNLKELGYSTFAIHNNTGTFYERYEVYPNLGFDTFISSEFMTDIETTPQGWIKDKCITPQIQKCLESTEEQDFIFAVSVQGHGSFPEEGLENPEIEVTSSPFEEELENQLEYYVNQIYEMDLFVKELTEYLSEIEEPTILVLYGDHIPSLNIDASYYEDGDNYQTSYVIWANFDVEEVDQDLATYQLLPEALDLVDISEGVLTQLHQQESKSEKYLEYMQLVQYDLLYGDVYIYEGENYEPTEMTMGVNEMQIQTYFDGEYVYITSSEITESSVVFINDKKVESILTSSGNLQINLEDVKKGDEIVIKQISPDDTVLYESDGFEL